MDRKPRIRHKHPAHGVLIPGPKPVIVFLTACTRGRTPWLTTSNLPDVVVRAWQRADAWRVGRYVIMPDHVHLCVTPRTGVTLEKWVQYWKALVTKSHGIRDWRWQTDHWDVRLRRGDSYLAKWEYVRLNPVRHGLVAAPEEWPHQGEINALPWWSDV